MIQLRRLRLRNLRSFETADLRLPAGVTLLVGDVGAGKTSLLYAIEMALFGFAEVDPAFLVRHRAPLAEVVLTLEDEAHSYEFGRRFRRRVRKGRDVFELESAWYAQDGQRAAYSVTEIRERAIRLLGFPDNPNPRAHSDLWRWAVYVPQERMRDVLSQPPEERLESVRKALGLEQYRTAAENSQLVAAELRRQAEARNDAARAFDNFEQERTEIAAALVSRTAEAEAARSERDAAQSEIAAERSALGALEERREALARDEALRAEAAEADRGEQEALTRLQARTTTRQRERERLRSRTTEAPQRAADLEEAARARDRLVEELESAAEQRRIASELVDEGARASERVAGLQKAIALATDELQRLGAAAEASRDETLQLRRDGPQHEPPAPTPRSIAEIDAAIGSQEVALRAAVAQRAGSAHEVSEVESLLAAGVCPRCHQPVATAGFEEHRMEAVRALAHFEAAISEKEGVLARLAEERRARERYERAVLRWQEAERARSVAARRAEEISAQLEASRRRHRTLAEESAAAEAGREALAPRLSASRSALDRLTELERQRAALDARVAELSTEVAGDRAASELLDRLASEEAEAERERQAHEARRSDLAGRLRDLDRRLEERGRLQEELQRRRASSALAADRFDRSARAASRAEAMVESTQHRLEEADRRLRERTRLLQEVRRRTELAEWLAGPFRTAALSVERRLLARAQSEFERSFASFFATLVEDPALIARCDAAFSPSVEIDGEYTPSDALSGGERTALALAFRLALGGVVREADRLNLTTLLLDEPTDGFSPEQVVRMGELLERLNLPQVVIVSHEAQLSAVADRVVRVEKRGGRSELVGEEGAGPAPESPGGAPASRPRRVRTPRLDAATRTEAPTPAEPTRPIDPALR